MKRFGLALVLFAALIGSAAAEQITKIGVVDLGKIYTTFFKDSQAVRDLEKMQQEITAEVEVKNKQIVQLKEEKLVAENEGDSEKVLELDQEIFRLTQYIREYTSIKKLQYKEMRDNLLKSSDFLKEISQAIKFIAENEGYSLIMRKSDPDIYWHSQQIDITELVLKWLVDNR